MIAITDSVEVWCSLMAGLLAFWDFLRLLAACWPLSGLVFMGCSGVNFNGSREKTSRQSISSKVFLPSVKGGKCNETRLCLFLVIVLVLFCLFM